MKKYLLFPFLFISLISTGQVIEKGNFYADLGTGFGLYSISDNDSSSENDLALPGLINLGLGYSLTDKFSLGIILERNGFLTEQDSSNKAFSQNISLDTRYLVINKEKTTINGFVSFGYSIFQYTDLAEDQTVKSGGTNMQIGIGIKHFFTPKFGFFFNSSYAYYAYNHLEDDKGNTLKVNDSGSTKDYKISLSGMNFRLGLTLNL